jgi:hypothetical protein
MGYTSIADNSGAFAAAKAGTEKPRSTIAATLRQSDTLQRKLLDDAIHPRHRLLYSMRTECDRTGKIQLPNRDRFRSYHFPHPVATKLLSACFAIGGKLTGKAKS